jgi:hypothetical protein
MEIDARPAVVFKQIYDGQNSYSSMPGVEVPPLTKFGLGSSVVTINPAIKVTAIADKKKQRGFRIEDPEGYTRLLHRSHERPRNEFPECTRVIPLELKTISSRKWKACLCR